jgi:hypothetical protein
LLGAHRATMLVDVHQPGATPVAVALLVGEAVAAAVVVALLAGVAVVVLVAGHPVGVETAAAQLTAVMDHELLMVVVAQQHMEEPLHMVEEHRTAVEMMARAPRTEASTQTQETAHLAGEAQRAPRLPRPASPHRHLVPIMRQRRVHMRLPHLVVMGRTRRLHPVVRLWMLQHLGYTLLLHLLLHRLQGLGSLQRLRRVVKIRVIIREGAVRV